MAPPRAASWCCAKPRGRNIDDIRSVEPITRSALVARDERRVCRGALSAADRGADTLTVRWLGCAPRLADSTYGGALHPVFQQPARAAADKRLVGQLLTPPCQAV